MRRPSAQWSMYAAMEKSLSPDHTIALTLMRLFTLAVFLAWLVVAGYALDFLVSH